MWRSSPNAKALAQDMYQALWSFVVCVVVTVTVSLVTKPCRTRPWRAWCTGKLKFPIADVPFYQKPLFWAAVVTVVFFILNIISGSGRGHDSIWFFIGLSMLVNGALITGAACTN